jgi:hypothetical protein
MHDENSWLFELPWTIECRAEPRPGRVAARPSGRRLAIDRVVRVGGSPHGEAPQAVMARLDEVADAQWQGNIVAMQCDMPMRSCRGCGRLAPVWSELPQPDPLDEDSSALLRMEGEGGRSPDQCPCGDWFE